MIMTTEESVREKLTECSMLDMYNKYEKKKSLNRLNGKKKKITKLMDVLTLVPSSGCRYIDILYIIFSSCSFYEIIFHDQDILSIVSVSRCSLFSSLPRTCEKFDTRVHFLLFSEKMHQNM